VQVGFWSCTLSIYVQELAIIELQIKMQKKRKNEKNAHQNLF
jgi:hypothetical protein